MVNSSEQRALEGDGDDGNDDICSDDADHSFSRHAECSVCRAEGSERCSRRLVRV